MNDDIVELDQALREFVAQDDDTTLVLTCAPADLAVPAKLLEAQGRQDEDAVFIMGIAACPTAQAWMDALARLLQNQVTAANGHRAEAGLQAWPALPLVVMDSRQPPAQRLRAAADYCASVVPEPQRTVWVLLPHECTDEAGYAEVVRSLCTYAPWQERHRFIVWDAKEQPRLVPHLEQTKNEDAQLITLDFSAPRQLDHLVKVAGDRARPADARMEALYQLAAVDFAYQRYAEALEKYGVLFNYYEGKDKTRQALCLLGAGDVAMEHGRPGLALPKYQSGLALAVPEQTLAAMLPLLMGAGRASLALARAREAEDYFDKANGVAGKLMNPYAKADALEQRGVAQRAQRALDKVPQAEKSWQTCRELCEAFTYEARWTSVLGLLLKLYDEARMSKQAADVRARLSLGFERFTAQAEGA